jgi:hypothetical protein
MGVIAWGLLGPETLASERRAHARLGDNRSASRAKSSRSVPSFRTKSSAMTSGSRTRSSSDSVSGNSSAGCPPITSGIETGCIIPSFRPGRGLMVLSIPRPVSSCIGCPIHASADIRYLQSFGNVSLAGACQGGGQNPLSSFFVTVISAPSCGASARPRRTGMDRLPGGRAKRT